MPDIQLTEEQFKEIIASAALNSIEKFQKESGMDKVDWKHLMHPGEDEKSLEQKNGRERFRSLLKAMATKDYGMVKAADPMVEGTDASGGYLVPAVTRAEILRLIPTYGQLRNYVRIIPMGKTDTLTIPVKSAGSTVLETGEGVAITNHKPTLSYVQLLAKKYADIVSVSNELLTDANIDIQNYIISLFAESLATKEDSVGFGQIFNTSNTYGNEETAANLSSISYDNLIDVVFGVDQQYLRNAAWFMHRITYSTLRKLKDSSGRPLVTDAFAGTPPTMFGFPIVLVEQAPYSGAGSPVIVLGNLNNSYFGEKGGITLSVSSDAYFEQDLTGLKVTERFGFSAGLTSAYSVVSITA